MIKRVVKSVIEIDSNETFDSYLTKCNTREVKVRDSFGVYIDRGLLKGIVTSTDFIDGYVEDRKFLDIVNYNPIVIYDTDHNEEIVSKFEGHKLIPKIELESRRYLGVFQEYKADESFSITGDLEASSKNLIFIAEIGNNHNGSLERAFQLIDAVKASGAQFVKFQHRSLKHLYGDDESSNLGAEYIIDLLKKYAFDIKSLNTCFEYAKASGLAVMCTPWDVVALKELESTGNVEAYKIASADFTNPPLIKCVAATGKSILLSTGMTSQSEIFQTVKLLQSIEANYSLLHCNSAYPPPYEDLNLNYITVLKGISKTQVGYSGHERGYHCVHAAIALGATIIEKHITVDNNLEGTDHKISMLPSEFKEMVSSSSEVLEALGSTSPRKISQGEKVNRVSLSKSTFANKTLRAGEKVMQDDIYFMSPGDGIQPSGFSKFLGKTVYRDVEINSMFEKSHFTLGANEKSNYQFDRKWGVPVRHRDVRKFCDIFECPMLEVHFSYADIKLNHTKYFKNPLHKDILYHSPELFENDHVLDLCSDDVLYVRNSMDHLKRTIDAALEIHSLQNLKTKAKIVLNCGGFSEYDFLNANDVCRKQDLLITNLLKFKSNEYELLPQTMPPFPWHFGGKRFHNLMTSASNIDYICSNSESKICFDVSHSYMWACHSGDNFYDFTKRIAKYVSHMHISDSKSVTDEGLQIGEGNVDFGLLDKQLGGFGETFIVEIWQGHEDSGSGFKKALDELEGKIK